MYYDGIYYRKYNGKWAYYGPKKEGFGKGWKFEKGYWWKDGWCFTHYGKSWFRFQEKEWHWVGHQLPQHSWQMPKGKPKYTDKNPPADLKFSGHIIAYEKMVMDLDASNSKMDELTEWNMHYKAMS